MPDIEETSPVVDALVVGATSYGLQVVGGIVILVVGWMLASFAGRFVHKQLSSSDRIDETLQRLAAKLVRLLILAFVIVAVLNNFGVQTASIIAVLGAAGLAIGLALQGTLGHVASGILLLVIRPFEIGDVVEVGGDILIVEELGLIATEFRGLDGVFVIKPNTQVWSSTVRNFARNEKRRFDVAIGISYDDDINLALKTAREVLDGEERVLSEPDPLIAVSDLGDSSVDILVRGWTKTPDWWPTQLDVRKELKERFEEKGLTIPFPQRDVHLIKE